MHIKIASMIWGLEIGLNEKLVLLAYADHADQQGGSISPGVKTIASKTGYCRRSVQLITRRLERRGCLVRDGRGPGGTNRYFIPLPGEPVSSAAPARLPAGAERHAESCASRS
jgi:hypothetical protein